MSQEPNDPDLVKRTDELSVLTQEDFRALAHTGRELTKEVALDRLLQNILQTASQLTNSPETSVILRNERQPTLYFAAATGDEAEWVLSTFGIHSEKQIPIDGSKAGSVYKSGTSLVENVVKDYFSGVDDETKKATKSMVCVPLSVGDQRLGVMQVLNKTTGDYTQRDRVILEYFADQASVAIRNARLMESLLAHSGLYGSTRITDELFARMDELNQDAETKTLSVLFADMRGFTQLCQSFLNPVIVQERLSEFVSMLSRAVIDNDGIVNKFLGDGVMALFQGPGSSIRAVKCAFSMVEDFSEMKKHWDEDSNQQLDFLDLGVGITTDQVILGGIGNSGVRDYTAIGTAVNLAAAFESAARNGKRILCDQLTYRNVTDIVSKVEVPQDFLLQKPGQEVGVRYKCYHLQMLEDDQQVSVFISHSQKDKDYVEKLINQLKEHGVETWYSVSDIPKGTLWTAEIRKAISKCNWMAVIVSKNSANSKWIRREVDLALTAGHLEDRIIPIAIDDTEMQDVNEYLTTMQAIELSTCDDVTNELSKRFGELWEE
ncbi:MAG: TIR domain-containing protein [Candidatus Thiodiazotropha sp. (ex Lucinoma borealis)]|nr:TIR domain-containing protein [Candidatus Thiodiazotropha sp. (ex Lucinoma borealis)]